jgi:hypothetical protein
MTAIAIDAWDFDEEPGFAPVDLMDAREHDAHWKTAYWRERYYHPDYDYEDYAPAYCVGYIGHAQYGGDYDDAEKSLCANWERIKGASRLTLAEARQAMRAAWDRAAGMTPVSDWRSQFVPVVAPAQLEALAA